jgi:hypothetical protein
MDVHTFKHRSNDIVLKASVRGTRINTLSQVLITLQSLRGSNGPLTKVIIDWLRDEYVRAWPAPPL